MKGFSRWNRSTFWARFFGIIGNGQPLLDIVTKVKIKFRKKRINVDKYSHF